jgi:hypothetical protein
VAATNRQLGQRAFEEKPFGILRLKLKRRYLKPINGINYAFLLFQKTKKLS